MEDKRITITIPYEIWLKIRRLQEEGKVKSIQEACVKGLKLITK